MKTYYRNPAVPSPPLVNDGRDIKEKKYSLLDIEIKITYEASPGVTAFAYMAFTSDTLEHVCPDNHIFEVKSVRYSHHELPNLTSGDIKFYKWYDGARDLLSVNDELMILRSRIYTIEITKKTDVSCVAKYVLI